MRIIELLILMLFFFSIIAEGNRETNCTAVFVCRALAFQGTQQAFSFTAAF